MEPEEFATLVKEGNVAKLSLGEPVWSMQASETESRRLRRSLFIVKNVRKGEQLNENNVRAIRPGQGISPKYLDMVKGKIFNQDLLAGTPLSFDQISD